MRHRAMDVGTWILSRLVAKRERGPLMGDLAEEYTLRANTASSFAAFKWYLQQICASAPPLLYARFAQTTWVAAGGVAVLAYITVGLVEFIVNRVISSSSAVSCDPLGMVITFPMVVLVGYFAAYRPKAPIVLGAMMLLAVTVMTATAAESAPQWYRIAYFFAGPTAVFIGSALRSLRLPRC
jgi:hypothetical protein